MVPPCHHVSVLIMITHRVNIQVYPMNLLMWHRLGPKSILTLIKSMALNRGLPRISTQVIPMSLRLHHLDLKNMQMEANTKWVQICVFIFRGGSVLCTPQTQVLKPSGAHSDQDQPLHDPDPPYYREVALSDVPSQYAEEVETFRHILALPDPRDSLIPSQGWTTRKVIRSLGQEALLLCSPSSRLSKAPLINLSMTSRPQIYLRVNISNLLLPLLSGTRWDSLVMRTRFKSRFCKNLYYSKTLWGPYGQGSPTNSHGIGTPS